MPYSTENSFTGDGSTTDFTITFPFIEAGDIKARVDGTTTTAFSITGTTISFTTAPANTKAILVYRDTDIDRTKVTFQTGASVRAQDLNALAKQLLYAIQEEEQNTGTEFDLATGDKNQITVNTANDWTIKNNTVSQAMMTPNSIDSDQYINNSIDTAHIADDQVTYPKIQNIVTANRVLGRASAGEVQEVQVTNDMIADLTINLEDKVNHAETDKVFFRTEGGSGGAQWRTLTTNTLGDDTVTEAKLKISNAGSNGQFLQKQSGNTGGLTWVSESEAGPLRGFKTVKYTGAQLNFTDSFADVTDLSITYTPTLSSSIIVLEAHLNLNARARDQTSIIEWSSFEQQINVTPTGGSAAVVQEAQVFSTGAGTNASANVSYGAYLKTKWNFYEEYTNSNTTEKTFKVQLKETVGTLQMHTTGGISYFTLKEYTP